MSNKLKKIWLFFVTLALCFMLQHPLTAVAGYPDKVIKLIYTSDVGGGEGTEARLLSPVLKKYLGQQIVSESQSGAAGRTAFDKFQKTEPDGYKLLIITFPKSMILEVMDKTNYKTLDYIPIYAWSRSSHLLVVNSDSWKTFGEFLKAAKAKNAVGGLSGRGGTTHLTGLQFVEELGIKVNWVPYPGSSGSLTALAGKHLDFTICVATSAVPLIRAGKLRPLLLFSDERDPYMPDVPTSKDLNVNIQFIPPFRGVFAPPKTPPTIIKVLESAFDKAAKDPGFTDLAKKQQLTLQNTGSQELRKIVSETYPRIIKYQQMLKD